MLNQCYSVNVCIHVLYSACTCMYSIKHCIAEKICQEYNSCKFASHLRCLQLNQQNFGSSKFYPLTFLTSVKELPWNLILPNQWMYMYATMNVVENSCNTKKLYMLKIFSMKIFALYSSTANLYKDCTVHVLLYKVSICTCTL